MRRAPTIKTVTLFVATSLRSMSSAVYLLANDAFVDERSEMDSDAGR